MSGWTRRRPSESPSSPCCVAAGDHTCHRSARCLAAANQCAFASNNWLQRVYADSVSWSALPLDVSVREAERMACGRRPGRAGPHRCVCSGCALQRLAPFREARRWLDALRNVAFARLATLDPATRLEIAAGILAADLFGESLASATRVADAVLPWVGDANAVFATVRGNALGYALEYFSGQRRWEPAHSLVAAIDELYGDPGFGAVARSVSARRGFYYHYRRGDYAGALGQSISAVAMRMPPACSVRRVRRALQSRCAT